MNLKQLYKSLPKIQCPEGCTDCCSQVGVLRSEAIALGLPEYITALPIVEKTLKCAYCSEGKGCDVYDQRPFTCRLFGTVRSGPNSCAKVLTSDEDLLSVEQGAVLLAEYIYLVANSQQIEPPKYLIENSQKHDDMEHAKGNLQERNIEMIGVGKDGVAEKTTRGRYMHYAVLQAKFDILFKK